MSFCEIQYTQVLQRKYSVMKNEMNAAVCPTAITRHLDAAILVVSVLALSVRITVPEA